MTNVDHNAEPASSRNLFVAKLLFFCVSMGGTGWSRFQNMFYLENGLTVSQIGHLKSIGLVLKFVGEPILCIIADLTDQKAVFAMCILMQIFSMELLHWIAISFGSLLWIKIIRTATAPSGTFTTTASYALTKGSSEGFGRQRMFGSLAWGGGSFLAGAAIDMFGMDAIFWYSHFFNATCLFIILAFVPSVLFHKDSPEGIQLSTHGAADCDAKDPKQAIQNSTQMRQRVSLGIHIRKFLREGRQFLRSIPCRIVLLDAALYGFVMTVPDTFLFISLEKDWKASRTVSGLFTLLSTLSCLPLFWYSDRLIARLGHHRVMIIAKGTCVARLAVCALVPPDWPFSLGLLAAAQLTHGANFALFWAAAVDMLHRAAPPGLSASSLAALNMAYFTVAGAASGLVWGPVYDAHGAAAVFAASAALGLAVTGWFAGCRGLLEGGSPPDDAARAALDNSDE